MYSFILDIGSILLSAKARAPVNCFKDICIMPSDWVSIYNWFFFQTWLLEPPEKRRSVERNAVSKEGTELSCQDTLIVLQIGSRWSNSAREDMQRKREILKWGCHCQDLGIKVKIWTNRCRGSMKLERGGGWQLPAVLQQLEKVSFWIIDKTSIDESQGWKVLTQVLYMSTFLNGIAFVCFSFQLLSFSSTSFIWLVILTGFHT